MGIELSPRSQARRRGTRIGSALLFGRSRAVVRRPLALLTALLVLTAGCGGSGHAYPVSAYPLFAYGYNLSRQGPDYFPRNNAAAVTSARAVMKSLPALQVQASMGWGPRNPEPSPGHYDFASLDNRINLIKATHGTPVIDLCGAPDWMKGGRPGESDFSKLTVAPVPSHYDDFAAMAATIAMRYPQVKYFVVWKEFMGFWGTALPGVKHGRVGNWDVAHYTTLYNDVYAAIKRVRPDALVGGPYVPVVSFAHPTTASLPWTPQGTWGAVDQRALDAISYWLRHKAGADFLALDGPSYTKDAGFISNPLTETVKFKAVGAWIRARTSLPIWWMESPIQPDQHTWVGARGAALRIGALIRMAEGGLSAGLQWQPEGGADLVDEGLWTSTTQVGGGKPTILASLLAKVLPILQEPLVETAGEPAGVLVASSNAGFVALNTNGVRAVVVVNGARVSLSPGQVLLLNWLTR